MSTTTFYIGPDIPGVVLANQVFTYKPVAVIAEAAKKSPLAKYLFIPMKDIVEAKKSLREEGSIINEAYKQTKALS